MKILNRKALHNYHILESLEGGLQLTGPEVRSIKEGRVELGQSFIRILNEEAFMINAHIPLYKNSQVKDYNPSRSRRVLLHRDQIKTLIGKTSSKGITLVPVSIYEKNNYLKVQVGLAKSKKEFDKRDVIKARDHQRRIEQELRGKE